MTVEVCKNILAKPSGITLVEHNQDVVEEALSICKFIPASIEKYKQLTGKDLLKRLKLISEYHDKGKKVKKWQDACQEDYLKFLEWKKRHPISDFKEYSKNHPNEAGTNLRKTGIRHEMYSLKNAFHDKLPLSLCVAIAAHHAKLGIDFEDLWTRCDDFKSYWTEFRKESYSVIEESDFKQLCDRLCEYGALRGLLRLADHIASAKEDGSEVSEIRAFTYKFPYEHKRDIQALVEEHWNKEILLVRAPTGAGKTDACLLWASKQIGNLKADRLIIAMPTRFTANALAVNVAEEISSTGIYHSTAWFSKESDIASGNLTESIALWQHKLARDLAFPTTVCTIDHLLVSLTLTSEDDHLTTYNLSNSCVVIDEADFYDDFTLANIMFLLKVLREWKVPVMIMSASLPDSALGLYRKIGYNVDSILEVKNEDYSRNRFNIKEIREYEEIEELNDIIDECIKQENAIFYFNTVDKAITAYKLIKDRINDYEKDIPVVLYHSRFTEPDKCRKEKDLIDMLGRKARESGNAKGIAILTQIGEISINISSNIMVSDMCPIDRFIQRAGRLCRFSRDIGTMYVITPRKEGNSYPAPYGVFSMSDRKWEDLTSYSLTKKYLKTGIYSNNSLLDLLNQVYNEEPKFTIEAQSNAKELGEKFKCNWLILPVENANQDDATANFWKIRNIPPQGDLFVCQPKNNIFYKYSDYTDFKMKFAVSLPVYLLEKGRKNHILDQIKIEVGQKDLTINVLREGFYNCDTGVELLGDLKDNFL